MGCVPLPDHGITVFMFLLRMVLLACGLLVLAPPPADAALKIEGTRLIYFGQDKAAGISVVNQASREVVVQTWITGEDESADRTVPFAATEPLVHLSLVNLRTDSQTLSDYLLLKPHERKTLTALDAVPKGAILHFTEITDIGLQARHSTALN